MVFVCLALAVSTAQADVTGMFPEMDGWESEGDPEVYDAGNLFEYINGAADLYIPLGTTCDLRHRLCRNKGSRCYDL